MGKARYEYRLWRDRSGLLGRIRGDLEVISPTTGWFDLDDKAGTIAALARLIHEHDHDHAPIDGYWLEIIDPGTGLQLTKVTASQYDLATIMDGTTDANGSRIRSRPVLEDVSTEALLNELARRLRVRAER